MGNILSIFLTKSCIKADDKLMKSIIIDFSKRNGKEEVLELINDLCEKGR